MEYAWIIDADLSGGEPESVGKVGPRNAPTKLVDALKKHGAGQIFTMGDDDGVPYYRGRIVGEFDGTEPLDDFGTPNAGCTWISEGLGGQKQSIV